jgi:hypothetical protein
MGGGTHAAHIIYSTTDHLHVSMLQLPQQTLRDEQPIIRHNLLVVEILSNVTLQSKPPIHIHSWHFVVAVRNAVCSYESIYK